MRRCDMRRISSLTLVLIFVFSSIAYAGWVRGYTRKDGTYVQGHYRSNPNPTVKDNYSYKDNINPYTGKQGTDYYRDNPTSDYYGTTPKKRGSASSRDW